MGIVIPQAQKSKRREAAFTFQAVDCRYNAPRKRRHAGETGMNSAQQNHYTTRVYKEIGKYKVGDLYTAPWGDILKIDEVKTYWKVSDRPFYDEMNDDEKIEICKYSEDIGLPYEFINFQKVQCDYISTATDISCQKSENAPYFGFIQGKETISKYWRTKCRK